MLILRENLTRPLTWSELDHNAQVLEINGGKTRLRRTTEMFCYRRWLYHNL